MALYVISINNHWEGLDMNVENILKSKGSKVYTVELSHKVNEIVEILNAKNIGVVVVLENNKIVGIVSERDIIRRMRDDGAPVLLTNIKDCMTPNPKTCKPQTSIDEVMQIMTDMKIRHLPIVENDKLVGLISIGDVVKRKIEQAEGEAAALRDYISG
jgi:CBS domain-containing protein